MKEEELHPNPVYTHVRHRCERCDYGCIQEEGMRVIDCKKVYWIPEIVVKGDKHNEGRHIS